MKNNQIGEDIVLNPIRLPSQRAFERLMRRATRRDIDPEMQRLLLFAALSEVERLGDGEITEQTAPLVMQVLKAISGLTMYKYLHKLQIVVREGLLSGRPGYKLASSMFAAIFQSAATFEFEHRNFKLAWRLCLESLRIEVPRRPEIGAGDGGVYDPLILLAAIYVRLGDLSRAFAFQQMAIDFNQYVWKRPAFLDSAGNWYLIPALSDQARIAYQQGNREEAIELAKAAVTQSYRGDRNCATFRRMNVLLAKLFLIGKDYDSTLRCLKSMNYAGFIEVDCSASGFEVAVNGLCSQYGVSLS